VVDESNAESATTISADLCVVGAGIAALNALAVASEYLEPGQRVVLVERRQRCGGMWNDAYGFVRLHQPHEFFTAGSIAWLGDQPPSYLASRDEVLDHFDHVLDVVRGRVELDERFGHEFVNHEERDGRVLVRARSVDGEPLEIDAARLIKGFGFEVGPDVPLSLTSERVRSIAPSEIPDRRDELLGGQDPIWIVGGGKTAMDTAHLLITEAPGRDVNMIIGSGTLFTKRDRVFPNSRRDRWRLRPTPNMLTAELARRFDGTNEAEVRSWMRETYAISLVPDAANYFFGVLSEAENETISQGLQSIVSDYLTDVVDSDVVTELVFRSGASREVAAGSWIVNCTGLIRPVERPYEPYASPSGNVLAINQRSWTLGLPAFAGYFLTHLMYRDKLATTPLYAVDFAKLNTVGKSVTPFVLAAVSQYNFHFIADALGAKPFAECGLDFDRWVPAPHRLASRVAFVARGRRDKPRLRAALDTTRERFDIRCGPLELTAPARAGR
jgi:hypothetical protein